MRRYFLLLILFLAVFQLKLAAGTYSGGTGTSGDPYQLSTTNDMIELSNTSSDWGAYFILNNDISFNADETQVDWDGDGTADWDAQDQLGFSPIGYLGAFFTGSFDGKGFTVNFIYIDRTSSDDIGLFGYVQGAEIRNLGVQNVDIIGNDDVGGFVGQLVGSSINNCYSTGVVSGTDYVGGFSGYISGGNISNSYSTGNVSGTSDVGGFVGFSSNGNISNSYSTGSVSGTSYAGGFVGFISNGNISNSYSTGNVSGTSNVGGFVGFISGGNISNSYSTGSVDGTSDVGGFVGYIPGGNINNSYSTGSVAGSSRVGGFAGFNPYNDVNNSFWDTQTSGKGSSDGGTGLTTAQMKVQSNFTGWDFNGTWNIEPSINSGYLYLGWEHRIYVDKDASSGDDDGSNWENAFLDFQNALNAAVSGDQICVAAGTYKPSQDYDLGDESDPRLYHFRLKNGIGIYGGFAGTESLISERTDFDFGGVNETFLSGDVGVPDDNSDNCLHVFYHAVGLGLDSTAILDGFSLIRGNADIASGHQRRGGAIYNSSNSPTFVNLSIYENHGILGGSIYNNNCTSTYSNVLIFNNISIFQGGGIFISSNCYITLSNVTLTGNIADVGGGIFLNNNTEVVMNNCIITGNSATFSGDQAYHETGTTLTLNYSNYASGPNDIAGNGTFDASNNNITTSPFFIDPSNNDYRLFGYSPCVNSGNNSDNPILTDIRGRTRIQNTTIDMGAYEWTSGIDPLCQNTVYVDASYNSGTPGWGLTHFDDLTSAMTITCSGGTINLSQASETSYTGNIDLTGYTVIVGDYDFNLEGEITGGGVQTPNSGRLRLSATTSGTTFPLTDGSNTYSLNIAPASGSHEINVKITPQGDLLPEKQSETMRSTTVFEIQGDINLDAILTFSIPDASLIGETLPENTVFRFWNGTRYAAISSENITVIDNGTYYTVTITNVNEF